MKVTIRTYRLTTVDHWIFFDYFLVTKHHAFDDRFDVFVGPDAEKDSLRSATAFWSQVGASVHRRPKHVVNSIGVQNKLEFVDNLVMQGCKWSFYDIPLGKECRTSGLLATTKVLPSERWKLLLPSSPVARTSRVHVHGIACAAPGSDCSNTSATSIAADTDSFRLCVREIKQNIFII